MNQSTEEQLNSTKKVKSKKMRTRKTQAMLAVAVALLALLVVPIFAWLYMQRSMETITKVNMPNALRIGAGDTQPIQQLELSNIDVSGETKSKDVVFCVYSTQEGKQYYLQLAHTTNIGFTYEIYKASMDSTGAISYLGNQYTKGDLLSGKYLNNNGGHATNTYHSTTYGNYNNVQISAEPLYWKTDAQEELPHDPNTNDSGFYVNYYILHISWDENVQNDKETDMIYLMVG